MAGWLGKSEGEEAEIKGGSRRAVALLRTEKSYLITNVQSDVDGSRTPVQKRERV